MSAHTPGPWTHAPGDGIIDAQGRRIAALSYRGKAISRLVTNEEAMANGDLFSAAPDLLRALVDLVRETDGGAQPCGQQFHQAALDAIQKATP